MTEPCKLLHKAPGVSIYHQLDVLIFKVPLARISFRMWYKRMIYYKVMMIISNIRKIRYRA